MQFPADAKARFEAEGYYVGKQLFSAQEVAAIREHFMALRAEGPKPGDMGGDKTKGANDPLNKFARMINMHRWDDRTKAWQTDERFTKLAEFLIGDGVLPCQTMLYFKPPGARGQGLHQDHQYIRQTPIIAAWLALDDCDAANGQMVMVPGSHKVGLLPVKAADLSQSFTSGETVIPEGMSKVGVDMKAGDVLYFGGFIIHGSYPNTTTDRFRRTFIVHYYGAHTTELSADEKTMMSKLAVGVA